MHKRMKIMIIALAFVFGSIIAYNLFKQIMIKRFFANHNAPPVTVSSVFAVKKSWEPSIAAVGNFVALNGVEVNSEASGNIVHIHFDSGQYIKKDSPLIDIDDSIDQATLKFNQADMALKDINYRRQTDLLKRGATSTSSVDEAKANLDQARANVEKIVAQIKQKHISAPFSGRLGIRQVNLGQYVTPGQTSIVSLQTLDPLYLEFSVPEQQFNRLAMGQKILFNVEEFKNVFFEGKITAINSKVDPNTHTVLVQATLPNCPAKALKKPEASKLIKIKTTPDNKKIVSCDTARNSADKIDQFILIPGMFAAISVEQPSIPDVIVLPSTAISYSLYGNSVFVIEEKDDKKLHVRRVFVTTGGQDGNDTIITSGIKEGQQVVSSGELKLQNDATVIINNSVKLNAVSNPDELDQ